MSETNDQRIYDRCIIRVGQLEADNAKLRELVSDLWTHCPADRYYCALCEYGNDDGSECKLADRMRELGVADGKAAQG